MDEKKNPISTQIIKFNTVEETGIMNSYETIETIDRSIKAWPIIPDFPYCIGRLEGFLYFRETEESIFRVPLPPEYWHNIRKHLAENGIKTAPYAYGKKEYVNPALNGESNGR